MVTTTGNSSGSSEMARVRPARRPPFQSDATEPVDEQHRAAARDRGDGHRPHQPGELRLQRALRGGEGLQRVTDAAHLGAGPGAPHHGLGPAGDDQGARVDERGRSLARRLHGDRGGTARFPTATDSPVSSDSFTLSPVAETTTASAATRSPSWRRSTSPGTTSEARNPDRPPVAANGGLRAREVLQRLQRALGLSLLEQADDQHQHHRRAEDQRLGEVAERDVDRGADDEQEHHRLAHHFQQRAPQPSPALGAQGVRAELREQLPGLLAAEPAERGPRRDLAGPARDIFHLGSAAVHAIRNPPRWRRKGGRPRQGATLARP